MYGPESGVDRLIAGLRADAARTRRVIILTVGPFLAVAVGILVVGVIALVRYQPAPRPSPPPLSGDQLCAAYDADIALGNTVPVDEFDRIQGLSPTQSADLTTECANYTCEPLRGAAELVRFPGWSAIPGRDRQPGSGADCR